MLQLHFKVVKAAEDIAAEAVQGYYVWQGRTPFTIAAAILFVAMSLAEVRRWGWPKAPGHCSKQH